VVRAYEKYFGEIEVCTRPAFEDIKNDPASEWFKVTEKGFLKGLTGGYQVGGKRYFHPDHWVSRGDAVAFVEKLAGSVNAGGSFAACGSF
jgi:hypothetical protein